MKPTLLPLALLVLSTACPIPERRPGPPGPGFPPEPPGPALAVARAQGVPLRSVPQVTAALRAPERAKYDPRSLGVSGKSISLQLTNTGPTPVDVDPLRVSFSAMKGDVPFPCRSNDAAPARREPTALDPGQSFEFERDLDCTLPLPGRYEVTVFARLGPDAAEDRVGTFPFELEDGTEVPRPYPSREGLYFIMTGAAATQPLPAEAWAHGDYHVVVAAINASPRSQAVGAAHLTFRVYRKGSPYPCSGEAQSVALPAELMPGGTSAASAPVSCALNQEGDYLIVGRLTLLGTGGDVEIGRIGLHVTSNPLEFTPVPWRFLGEQADSSARASHRRGA